MTFSTGVIAITRATPESPGLSVATNETLASPPSALQVQLGGFIRTPRHVMFGCRTTVLNWLPPNPVRPTSSQLPAVAPVTRSTRTPGGGNHWNASIQPIPDVFANVSL